MIGNRIPFLILALLALLTGIWTGLHRIGWSLSAGAISLHHGAIMVGGFMGTLISLEKIIPLKQRGAFLVPALSGLSVILFIAGFSGLSIVALVIASIALTAVFAYYLLRHRDGLYALMLTGSLCWLTGNVMLLSGRPYPAAFPWWVAFGLFIITAERLELTKFLPVSRSARYILTAFLGLFLLGAALSFHGTGRWVSGTALCGIALWLLRYDVISISLRKEGLPKYIALALFAGYSALLLTGVFILFTGRQAMGYDVVVHTFFLGFIFSMIFAHGPVILPGVLGVSVKPYHPVLYVWLCMLHLSWIIRVGSDFLLDFPVRRTSGVLSAVALVAFFLTMAALTRNAIKENANVH